MKAAQTGSVIVVVTVITVIGSYVLGLFDGDLVIGDNRLTITWIIRLGIQQIAVLIVLIYDRVRLCFSCGCCVLDRGCWLVLCVG